MNLMMIPLISGYDDDDDDDDDDDSISMCGRYYEELMNRCPTQ
jgi:pectate lyase